MADDFAADRKDRTLRRPYTTGEPIAFPSQGATRRTSTASPMRPRMWWPIRSPTTTRGSTPPSTGTRPSPSAIISGTSASASPKRWTPRSAAAGSTGPAAKQLIRHALEAAKAPAGREDLLRRRHRSSRRRAERHDRRRHPRLRGADRGDRGDGRAADADGEPRARPRRQEPRTITPRSTAASSRRCSEPVIIHWLGEMFDPALAGYWGSRRSHGRRWRPASTSSATMPPKIDGVKISLLSREKEIDMRRKLPAGVRMYTGDDFNYAELIAGDEEGYSDALLGIFDAIAPAASAGLARLANGDVQGFHGILEPTVPLSRHIFKAPTRFYKTGVVFLAWLNGLQDHFIMVGGQESARSIAASRRAVPPGRQGARAARSRARGSAHEQAARRARLLSAPMSARQAFPSISRPCASNGICARRWKPACATASPRSIRGATRWPALGLAESVRVIKDSGMQGQRLLPRRHVPQPIGRAQRHRRQQARDRRGGGARRANAWCWWCGGLPTGSRDIGERAQDGRRRHGGDAAARARRQRAARDRAAASDVCRRTAPA